MLLLLGMGAHGKGVSHTFKLLKGGVSMFHTPNQRDQREQEAQHVQLKWTPLLSMQ